MAAKGKSRRAAQASKARRKSAGYLSGGGQSKYALRHRGGGSTRPGGMWLTWNPGGTPGAVTGSDLRMAAEERREQIAEAEYIERARIFG